MTDVSGQAGELPPRTRSDRVPIGHLFDRGRHEPAFDKPWHARVFALTLYLNQTGKIDWPDWSRRLGATLARRGLAQGLDGGTDYYDCWLETLENFLTETGATAPGETDRLKAAWESACLSTPHGTPVKLPPNA